MRSLLEISLQLLRFPLQFIPMSVFTCSGVLALSHTVLKVLNLFPSLCARYYFKFRLLSRIIAHHYYLSTWQMAFLESWQMFRRSRLVKNPKIHPTVDINPPLNTIPNNIIQFSLSHSISPRSIFIIHQRGPFQEGFPIKFCMHFSFVTLVFPSIPTSFTLFTLKLRRQ